LNHEDTKSTKKHKIFFLLPQAESFLSGVFPPDKKFALALLRVLRAFVVKNLLNLLNLNHEDTKSTKFFLILEL